MEQNNQLIAYYENEGLEELRLNEAGVQHLEFLTAMRYFGKTLPPKAAVLDSCAGSGAYAFALAGQGHRVTAGDLVPYNVEVMRQKQPTQPALKEIYEGDATDLSRFDDASFDAVLCMGALYHLLDKTMRRRAVAESLRVLKPGGLFYCTYINRYAVIMNNLEKNLENIEEILEYSKKGIEGIFYASTAGEIEALAQSEGLEKNLHVALDGMACFLVHTSGLIALDAFDRWKQYHFAVCEDQSLLGASYHNLYVGRKK